MNGLPYYKAYPRDFIEGTIGMPFELKGAYRLVLDLIYMQGGKLPDDPRYISGLLGCSLRKWKSLREQLVQMGKLDVSGEFLTNKRAEKEVETLAKHQEQQRENASRPRKNNDLEKPSLRHTEPESYNTPYNPPDRGRDNDKEKPPPRGSALPKDWTLSKQLGNWAVDQGLSELEVRKEAERFRDYWIAQPGAKGRKKDWDATWRNWIRTALERKPSARPVGGGSSILLQIQREEANGGQR